jgi:hypothetical protein
MPSPSRAGHRASSPTSATAGPDAQATRLVTCAPNSSSIWACCPTLLDLPCERLQLTDIAPGVGDLLCESCAAITCVRR